MKKQTFSLLILLTLSVVYSGLVYASWIQHGIDWNFPGACDVVVCDFDGEQDPDVAGLNTSGIVNVYENDGNQQFTTHLAAQVPANCRLLRAGDLDNDGDMDLVAATHQYSQTGGIYRLMNNGDWNFSVFHVEGDYLFFDDLIVVDLDNDGDQDLVGIHDQIVGERLAWWENRDNGERFVEHHIAYCQGTGLGSADLDDDGDIDLTLSIDGDIVWLENTENQVFIRHIVGPNPPQYVCDVKPGDLDNDGDLDIIVGTNEGVFCYTNNGNLIFLRLTEIPSAIGIYYVQVLDVDGDGCNDIACISGTWDYLYWIENFMCRDFHSWQLSQPGVGIVKCDTCDFNGDGKIDFAVTGTMTANNIQWYENTLDPTVKLQVNPVEWPIIIPPEGGSFDFIVHLWNTTTDTQSIDL